MKSLNIVVLAKQVPDTRQVGKDAMTAEGTVNRAALPAIFNPEDLNALELALRLKESREGSTVHILTMGPQRAADIANCVRNVASQQLESIMDVDAVNLVYEAEVPERKSGPSVVKNTAIAALLGLLCAVGIFVIIYVLDDTIRTEEDVERHLGLSVLGVIPLDKELSNMAMLSDFEGTRNRKRAKKILHTNGK